MRFPHQVCPHKLHSRFSHLSELWIADEANRRKDAGLEKYEIFMIEDNLRQG